MTSFPDDPDASDADRMQALFDGAFRDSLGLKHADVELMRHVAGMSFARGAYREAMTSYASIVLLEPNNVEAQIGFAESALKAEVFDAALHAASVAVLIAPQDPRGYLLSGRACLKLGMEAEAREDFGRASSLAEDGGWVADEAKRWLGILSPVEGPGAQAAAAQ